MLEAGVSPDALDFTNRKSLKDLTVALPLKLRVMKDNGLFFNIGYQEYSNGARYFRAEFFPSGTVAFGSKTEEFSNWNSLISVFSDWAQKVRVELDEPDPSLLIEQGRMLLGSIPTPGTHADKFSEYDLHFVHESVGRIRKFLVSEIAPNEQQLSSIDERLRYLEESAKTQDKKAWAYTSIGVAFTIASALALSPEQGQKLFVLTSELLKGIFMRLLT